MKVRAILQRIQMGFKWVSLIYGVACFLSPAMSHGEPIELSPSINHILSTGQSLAIGQLGNPRLSISQPFRNLKIDSHWSNNYLTPWVMIPLIEYESGSTSEESMSSSLVNMLSEKIGNSDFQIASSINAWPGACYCLLRKSSVDSTYKLFEIGINQAKFVKNYASERNLPYRILGVTSVHGEADQKPNPYWAECARGDASLYASFLAEWQRDYQVALQSISATQGSVPLFINQMSSWTHPMMNAATPGTAIGQWQASFANPDKVILTTPSYIFDYADGVHLDNEGYRRLGAYFSKAMKRVSIDGLSWAPVWPTEVSRTNQVVKVKFHVPVTPLVFDTEEVLAKENFGFEYYEDGAPTAQIQRVSISAPDTVEIQLDRIPEGQNERLRYAYTGTPGAHAGRFQSGAPRGNLRDSDTTTAYYDSPKYGKELFNWAISFDSAILKKSSIPESPKNLRLTGGTR